MSLPKVDFSKIQIPNINLPSFDLSSIQIPSITIPKMDFGNIQIPEFRIPSVKLPKISFPKIDLGSIFRGKRSITDCKDCELFQRESRENILLKGKLWFIFVCLSLINPHVIDLYVNGACAGNSCICMYIVKDMLTVTYRLNKFWGVFFTVCGSQYVNSMKSRQAYLDKLKLLNSALESDFVYNVGNMYL